jgi:hypothetical protein
MNMSWSRLCQYRRRVLGTGTVAFTLPFSERNVPDQDLGGKSSSFDKVIENDDSEKVERLYHDRTDFTWQER